ncbi:M35 family metallo-endopeptidase [Nevskia sp.]|uniref:M35 family metallo-endopeptidase n=1 Tax=Nevskia sp. TaxID=1929292 RepID=UPI0025ED0214|nr:M35 family metallo-endopeptidase [Nevskia sp.]
MAKIMSYDEWMRRTRRGLTKPRSDELRRVDTALKAYSTSRGDPGTLEALSAAVAAWQQSKDDLFKSVRNTDGAVTELVDGIIAALDQDKAGRQAQVKAVNNIARMNRPAGFLDEVRGGAKRLADGDLDGKFARAGLATIVKDATYSNVSYEGFSDTELVKARKGWENAFIGAKKATMGMRAVQMGLATGGGQSTPERTRYTRWFGAANAQVVADMAQKASLMEMAMRTRPITFVHRPSVTLHYVNGNDPLGPTQDEVIGPGVYGYVWSAGNHTGNGMRIVCNAEFLGDPCPYEGAAATVYHELTHKVLGTSDKSLAGVTTYGIGDCTALARTDPASARNVADCWSYYAISFLKNI